MNQPVLEKETQLSPHKNNPADAMVTDEAVEAKELSNGNETENSLNLNTLVEIVSQDSQKSVKEQSSADSEGCLSSSKSNDHEGEESDPRAYHYLSVCQMDTGNEGHRVQTITDVGVPQSQDSELIISTSQNCQEMNSPQIVSSASVTCHSTSQHAHDEHLGPIDETMNIDDYSHTKSGTVNEVPVVDVQVLSQSNFSCSEDVPGLNTSLGTEQEASVTMKETSQVSPPQLCEARDGKLDNMHSIECYEDTPRVSRYDLSSLSTIECIASASNCFQGQISDNYLSGCKWSPDGNKIMTNSNDNHLRIFTPDLQTIQQDSSLDPSSKIHEKSQIYDFCWYPQMSSSVPDTCRIACTCSNIPIHLWNSNGTEIVSSYRAYDQSDEIVGAHSIAFSPDGSKLFAGYNKTIRIFDTSRPGRTCKVLKTYDSKHKEGLRGIMSCFAFSQDASPVFVVGSYSRHVGVYDYASQQLLYMMQGQQGGVTHIMLSPDGTKLYTGGRKDPEIMCWDMRNTGRVLFTCLRDVQTNQRIYFDLSENGQYLVSGNHTGTVSVWDSLDPGHLIDGEVIIKPCLTYLAHQDCVNGVSLNHSHNILATTSGQRHFKDFDAYDSDSSSSSMSVDGNKDSKDFSLKFWKIPCRPEQR